MRNEDKRTVPLSSKEPSPCLDPGDREANTAPGLNQPALAGKLRFLVNESVFLYNISQPALRPENGKDWEEMKDEQLIQVVPSPRQLALQQMEFYAFVHFTVNTFTDREWGDGTEDPSVFNPSGLDAGQWVRSIQAAGMKGLILTCKHHDGFCLWPSRYTDHTVAASPFRGGRGDVVREVSEACARAGLQFGVYLSPWDRHDSRYGTGKAYDDYFVSQLTELLSGYGPIRSVWFDGACGEGANGKKQCYDWPRYYETIRRLQPEACIHVCGPDIRWCGNEAGQTRESEWSVVPRRTMDTEKITSLSQQKDDEAFRLRPIRAQDQDLGSRKILEKETDLIWYPAEVNTSIRPGWFWHEAENDQVKPISKLIEIYEKSVGGNATFLLNIPPDRRGLFHEADVQRLRELGEYLRKYYTRNVISENAQVEADAAQPGHEIENALTDDESYYLPAAEGQPVTITVRWPRKQTIHRLVLKEQLRLSQRIEHFTVDAWADSGWTRATEGTVVGHKRIVPLPALETNALRITIDDARVRPTLAFLGVYAEIDERAL